MFSPENIAILNQLFLDESKKSPTILGAKIGDIVKKQFPDSNIRSNYGSVRSFVEKNFSGILRISGRQGIDNVYAFNAGEFPIVADGVASARINDAPVDKSLVKPSFEKQVMSQKVPISDDFLRVAIKNSIDSMTSEQIRQLAIPAGILLDAINKTNGR